jgi:hypothetical protein
MITNVTQLLDPRTLHHTPEDLIPSTGWTRTSPELTTAVIAADLLKIV